MQLDRAGKFKAYPTECALSQSDSGSMQWVAKCVIAQMFNPESGEWDDVSDQGWTIPAYVNVVKKDGELNKRSVDNLKDTLGWDGADFATLQNDYSQVCIQIECDWETYNEKQSLRVKWVNPENYAGASLKPLDGDALKTLNSKFGGLLRQHTGAKPGAAAAAPAGPKPPAKPLPPKAPKVH